MKSIVAHQAKKITDTNGTTMRKEVRNRIYLYSSISLHVKLCSAEYITHSYPFPLHLNSIKGQELYWSQTAGAVDAVKRPQKTAEDL